MIKFIEPGVIAIYFVCYGLLFVDIYLYDVRRRRVNADKSASSEAKSGLRASLNLACHFGLALGAAMHLGLLLTR